MKAKVFLGIKKQNEITVKVNDLLEFKSEIIPAKGEAIKFNDDLLVVKDVIHEIEKVKFGFMFYYSATKIILICESKF